MPYHPGTPERTWRTENSDAVFPAPVASDRREARSRAVVAFFAMETTVLGGEPQLGEFYSICHGMV